MNWRVFSGVLCIFVILTVSGNITSIQAFQHEQDLQNAADFLLSQYNSTFHLLAEAPGTTPTIFWLWNDNFLGYHALEFYYPKIASTIKETLQSYGHLKNYAYEALFRQSVKLPFRAANNYTIEEGPDYKIKLDIYNGSDMEDWGNYTNLLCLAALSEYWQRNTTTALACFNNASAMWDGNGLVDAATDKLRNDGPIRYATYKLALLLYTEKVLGKTLSFHDDAENIIWQMQNRTNYGIHTDYIVNGNTGEVDPSGSNVNVETTALVIGAYKWYEPLGELKSTTLCFTCIFFLSSLFLKVVDGHKKWRKKL